jgi:hypothetical protein
MAKRASDSLSILVHAVDEAFRGVGWHGPALRSSLRGVTPKQAAWRPGRGYHNIWEVAVHAAYWKHIVRARLTGDRSHAFALKGSNWFVCPSPGRTWQDDVRMLIDEHRALRDAISGVAPAALGKQVHGRRQTYAYTIRGIAAHDVYHAGQIQLLKKLQGM